ncbi:SDR family oxidoreductase [Sphingobium fuliginis]|uniref:SDR family oxidoreductase n=1 Tax=Sphingobium fuliginis (strain ATCC 27551) TaxID=336203 RepID=A0A7M2GCH9_SPHSA|nr:SDR family oxidoreductase [Sphingobium fuliginis]
MDDGIGRPGLSFCRPLAIRHVSYIARESGTKPKNSERNAPVLNSLFGLSGKNALVVGAGKVPHAIASLFGSAGAAVTHAQEPELTEESVETLFDGVPELDILVNGAIVTGPWPLDDLTMDEWDRVHATNVRGAFLLMRQAVRTMRRHGRGGRLVNLSTIGSVHPVLHGNYAYGSSRAGMNALTRQFALDCADDGIASNAILVGAIPSDPFPEGCPMPPKGPGVRPERFPMGYGTPEDVAPVALLLASAAGRYINGQTIVVDGGFQIA